jgi:hypothetical protein
MLDKLDAKIACLAFNFANFAECFQLNVQMPADLDQFR